MKVTTNFEKIFTPIDFTIRIESKEEVAVLWAMFNSSPAYLRDVANEESLPKQYFPKDNYAVSVYCDSLFNSINEFMKNS